MRYCRRFVLGIWIITPSQKPLASWGGEFPSLKLSFFDGFDKDIKLNFDKYRQIHDLLADNISKNIFQNLLNFKLSGDKRYVASFKRIVKEQYFEPFLPLPQNPVFADVGGFVGDTSLEFIKRYPNFEKIYLFEPEISNFKQAKENLKAHKNIEFLQKGLGEKNEILHFSANGDASAISEDGEYTIEVVRLDDVAQGRVDFIKMDIEGAEASALKGAANTIIAHHPTLSICVYHKADDFWQIPNLVLSLRDDYKIFMRQYTQSVVNSVMHFVPIKWGFGD